MEQEQAPAAVEPMQAAPEAGVENRREQSMEFLLTQMTAEPESGTQEREVEEAKSVGGAEIAVAEGEPGANAGPAQRQSAPERREETGVQAAIAAEFPDALTPGTELHDACAEELAYLRESNSPLMHDPQVRYKVARRMARILGYRRPAEAVSPRRTVRPVPMGGTPVEPSLATLERRVAGAKSPGAMLELMREIGTPFEALLKKG